MIMQVLFIAFLVSYAGSIPPGTINVTTMQLSIQGKSRSAFFFALGASVTEFVYAGATVKFQIFLSERPLITDHFQIITALAMIILGMVNLTAKGGSKQFLVTAVKGRDGFKRGIILGVLNPLTIPFWLAVTAYLQSNNWIALDGILFWNYIIGISVGTFALLVTVNAIGSKFEQLASNTFLVYKTPGIIFLCLGFYNLIKWLGALGWID